MELRQYWSIVKSRLWIVVALTVLAFVFALVFQPEYQESYEAQTKLAIKSSGGQVGGAYYSAEYYNYLASEYLVDDIATAIESSSFLDDVQERLKDRPEGVPFGRIVTKKTHRVLTIAVTSSKAQDALDIARMSGEILSDPGAKYWLQLGASNPEVAVIQPAIVVAASGEKRALLDIGLKAVLGLLVGLGLAFLLDYLDGSLRDRGDAERTLGLQVLGEVPRERRMRLGRQ